jgi:hypothetical protein
MFFAIALILNALLGIYLLNWALKKSKGARMHSPELDAKYPALHRTDKDKINIPLLYVAASTVLIPRIIIGLSMWFTCFCILQ